jgi:hypothetical protein
MYGDYNSDLIGPFFFSGGRSGRGGHGDSENLGSCTDSVLGYNFPIRVLIPFSADTAPSIPNFAHNQKSKVEICVRNKKALGKRGGLWRASPGKSQILLFCHVGNWEREIIFWGFDNLTLLIAQVITWDKTILSRLCLCPATEQVFSGMF